MFIRAVETHSKNGKPRYSARLVRSERAGDKVRQIMLLNLGVNFNVPQDQWNDLVVHIQNLMQGQPMLFPDPELQAVAKTIVAKLKRKKHDTNGNAKPELPDNTATVDLDTIEHP